MRILVADDELVYRSKLQKVFEQYGEVDSCENGATAVEAFRKAFESGTPYGLLALDIVMPEIDGMQALHMIRQFEKEHDPPKRTPVLMVTSKSDKLTIISSVQAGCDAIVVKPFDDALIRRKLEDLGIVAGPPGTGKDSWLERMHRDVLALIERFKKGDIELPVFPSVVREAGEVVANPDSTISDLSHVIEKDAVTSAKLIAVANSPVFRSLGKVQSVSQAIGRLGFKETQKIIAAIASRGLYTTESKPLQETMRKQRLYSLASAYASGQIASALGYLDTEKYFVMGLVHDIGNVLLLWMVGEIKIEDESVDINGIVLELEKLHSSFGGVLLARWKFPEEAIDVARMHEGPNFSWGTAQEILIVNLAGHMAFEMGYGFYEREEVNLANLDATRLLKLGPHTLEQISKAVKETVEQASELL